jgi:hypothetical protein
LAALGPAAKPVIPQLLKLLGARDNVSGDDTSLGRQAAWVLGQISPDAAKQAVNAAKTELEKLPPETLIDEHWSDVLRELGPAAAPALVDALNDKCTAFARCAALALVHISANHPSDPGVIPSLARVTPKLTAAWQRVVAIRPPPPENPAIQQDPGYQHEYWMNDLITLAYAAGPKAADALIAAADAPFKQRRPDPAGIAAAAKEFARTARHPRQPGGMPDPQAEAAYTRMRSFHGQAVSPLCDLIATDAEARRSAVYVLRDLLTPIRRSQLAEEWAVRKRLLKGQPPPLIPLDAKNKQALAKAVPELLKLADTIQPDGQQQPAASVWWLLTTIAPDVPPASDALIARLDRTPEIFAPDVADALGRCDKGVIKKLETAATKGGARAKDVAFRVHVRSLPPRQAAQQIIATIPADRRHEFVANGVSLCSRLESTPLLIELLVDPPSDTAHSLKQPPDDVVPMLVAALDRPEPGIRAGVLEALTECPLTPPIIVKVASLLGDEATAQPAMRVLYRAGAAALDALIDQTKSASANSRATAVRALSVLAHGNIHNQPTLEAKTRSAARAIALLDDPEAAVRAAALNTITKLHEQCTQALIAKLKSADESARQRLAVAVCDNAPRSSAAAYEQRRDESADAPPRTPAMMLARFTLIDDAALVWAARDVLYRADVIAVDRQYAQRGGATTQESLARAKEIAQLQPKVRAEALASVVQDARCDDIIFDCLNDPDPMIRAAAVSNAGVALGQNSPRAPAALSQIVTMSQRDPARLVRVTARKALAELHDSSLDTRLRLLSHSAAESDRVLAASLYLWLDRGYAQLRKTDAPLSDVAVLIRLLDDPSPAVRRAAVISLARQVHPDMPQASAAQKVVELLGNASVLDMDAKAALVAAVALIAPARPELGDHADPDVQAAARLGIEQPPGQSLVGDKRVPVAMASRLLTSPSPRLRKLAANSLTIPDPADPSRQASGAVPLLAAAKDPNDAVAIDALNALIAWYAGPRVGIGAAYWEYNQVTGWERFRRPSAYEIKMQKLVNRATSGPGADRLEAIKEIKAGGAQDVGARWDVFIDLLEDDDAQVRAAAFAAARSGAADGVNTRFPAPQPGASGTK